MRVGSVRVVEAPQFVDVSAVDGAAVAVHEFAKLMLVEHLLQKRVVGRHVRATLQSCTALAIATYRVNDVAASPRRL